MGQVDILKVLRAQPFRPFRLRLSNDLLHEIRHPDMAIVTPTAIYVGVPAKAGTDEGAQDIVIVSMRHVLQIEPVPEPTPSGSNGAG